MKKQKLNKQRRVNLVLILLLIIVPLSARNIGDYYIEMPDVLNPVTNKKQRIELLEYYKAEMGDSIENVFGNQTHILKYDTLNNYISVKNTGISTFEMKTFILNNDTVIGIIRTVCTPICQSTIDFYNTSWERYTSSTFTMPKAVDWVNTEKINDTGFSKQDVWNALSLSFISLSFHPEKDEIIAVNNSMEYLEEKDRKLFAPVMSNDNLIYHPVNKKWIRK